MHEKTDPNPQPLTEGQKAIIDAIPRARDLQTWGRVERSAEDAWRQRYEALVEGVAAGRAMQPAPSIVLQATPEMLAAIGNPARDREADRARFPDPDFNRWLDDAVTETGEFSVWHMLSSTADAWAGWNAQVSYVVRSTSPPLTEEFIDAHIGADEGDREAVVTLVREVERAHGIVPEPEWQNDVQAAFGGLVQTPQG